MDSLKLDDENRPKKKLTTWAMRAALLEGEQHLTVERPRPLLSLITINRPEGKNLMTQRTRAQIFNQLQLNDQDPDVRVTIIRGAGGNFCAGHDFDTNRDEVLPFFEPELDGQTSRHVLNSFFMINDLAKPVIAMVEGEATGEGFELAAACDVCICADDAILGYNAVRGQGLADYQILPWLCGMRNAMELILTNKPMVGIEAAQRRFVTQSVPAGELEEKTLEFATRVAKIPSDLLAFNKKSVHRAFEAQGMRTNLRNAVDLETLMFKAPGAKMLTARRGPSQQSRAPGMGVPQRVPPPRPSMTVPSSPPAVAVQAVSATSEKKPAATPQRVTKPASKDADDEAEPEDEAMDVKAKAAPVRANNVPAKSTPTAAVKSTPQQPVATKSSGSATTPAKAPVTATKAAAGPTTKAAAGPAAPVKVAAGATTPAKATAGPATSVKAAATPSKPAAGSTGTPVKAASVAKPVTAPSTPSAKVAAGKSNEEGAEGKSVQIHLHEAVHIHIGGGNTPSKL